MGIAACSAEAIELSADRIVHLPDGRVRAIGHVRAVRSEQRVLAHLFAEPLDDTRILAFVAFFAEPAHTLHARRLIWIRTETGWRIAEDAPLHREAAMFDGGSARGTVLPLVRRWLKAWNLRDAQALADLYAPDAHPSEYASRRAWMEALPQQWARGARETLYANEAVLDPRARTITASGHIRVEAPQGTLTAARAVVQKDTITAEDAAWRGGGHFLRAQRIRRQGTRLEGKQLRYSSCPPNEQTWRVEAREGTLDLESGWLVARGARFLVGPMPVLYTPWIKQATRRHSGLLIPNFGQSSRRGWFVGMPIYLAPAPDWDATLTPTWNARRGWMGAVELRAAQPHAQETLTTEYIRDRLTHRGRGQTHWAMQGTWGGWQWQSQGRYVSDADYLGEFAPELASLAYTTSEVRLSRPWAHGSVALGARYQQNLAAPSLQKSTLQLLPSLEGRFDAPIGAHVSVAGEAFAVRFWRRQGLRAERAASSLSLRAAFGEAPSPYLRIAFGGHLIGWRLHPASPALRAGVQAPFATLDTGLTLAGLWGARLRHEIALRGFIAAARAPEQTRAPLFDSSLPPFTFANLFAINRYTGGDRIERARRASIEIRQNWLARTENGDARKIASLAFASVYFARQKAADLAFEPRVRTGWGPWLAEGMISPADGVALTVEARWDGKPRTLVYRRAALALSGEVGSLTLSDTRRTSPVRMHAWQASAALRHGRWQWRAQANYDRLNKQLVVAETSLDYQHPCWRLRLSAFDRLRALAAAPARDRGMRVLLDIRTAGSLAQP